MRTSYQQSCRNLPSTRPLKSPSPDLKCRSSIIPTMSPDQFSMKKAFNQYTPPNHARRSTYVQYSTLPNQHQSKTLHFQRLFDREESSFNHEKQYASTHAKGHHSFQVPNESSEGYYEQFDKNDKNDLIQTGKKTYQQPSTHNRQTKYISKEKEMSKIIQQKDIIISELKSMINLMTQNGKHLKHSQSQIFQEQYDNMKSQVKILTIQNQKLAQVINKIKQKNDKLVSRNSHTDRSRSSKHQRSQAKNGKYYTIDSFGQTQRHSLTIQESAQKLQESQSQIAQLKQTFHQKQISYQKQIDELIKSHKSLALQCKMYQNQKQRFSKQNQHLINLLRLKQKQKQTCYGNYSYFDKSQYQQSQAQIKASNNKSGVQNKSIGENSFNKLSIQRIKSQYQQNLKQYKQNVYNQVQNMFQTINTTLQQISQKVNISQERLQQMQKFRNSLLRPRTNPHQTSQQQGQEQIKKSAIYIQQGPSSQRISTDSKGSRCSLRVILQESRRDNQKLQLELSQLRQEVGEYRESGNLKKKREQSKSNQTIYTQGEVQTYIQRIAVLEDLVDQLREQKDIKQRQLIQLQHEMLKVQQSRQDNYRYTQLQMKINQRQSSVQGQIQSLTLEKQLRAQNQILKQQIQDKNQHEQKLRQMINDMESALDFRQKQLLGQIQQLQNLIKQTQQAIVTYKDQAERQRNQHFEQVQNLTVKVRALQNQNQRLSRDSCSIIQTHEDKITLQKSVLQLQNISLQTRAQNLICQHINLTNSINNQANKYKQLSLQMVEMKMQVSQKQEQIQLLRLHIQKMRDIHRSIVSCKQNIGMVGAFLEIESYVVSSELGCQRMQDQNQQLLLEINSAKDQVFYLSQSKAELLQKNRFLEQSIQIYKKQLHQQKMSYQSLLKTRGKSQLQPKSESCQQNAPSANMQRIKSKNQIYQLINLQKDKINYLMDLINQLSTEQKA